MQMTVVLTILWKELREHLREPWLCVGVLVLLVLLTAGLWGGERRFRELAAVQQTLQEEARRDWMEQDSPDAHTATHQGTFVYKRFSPLMAFDPGVEGLLGTKLRLESHQQQAMTDPLQVELIDPLQFDVSTPALLMQVVLPFFMILLTFSAVSREWEQGTLPLVLSTGQSWRVFVLGKMFAFLAMALLVVIPLGLFLLGNLWRMHHIAGMSAGNFTLRTLSLAVCCLLYLAGWSFLSLAISARAGSSRQALIILLSLWTFVVVLVPRAAVHVAEWAAPLPSLEEVERDRQDAVEYGDNGEHAYTKLYAELEAELLRKHGVSDPEDLPLNLTGAQLLAAENLTDRIYDESRARVERVYAAQDRFAKRFGVLSPYLALRTASMGLSGTDRLHHEAFGRAGEEYRRLLVRTMNEFDTVLEKPTSATSGPEVWGLVPEFRYQFPAAWDVLSGLGFPLLILLCWCLATGLWAIISPGDVLKRS